MKARRGDGDYAWISTLVFLNAMSAMVFELTYHLGGAMTAMTAMSCYMLKHYLAYIPNSNLMAL